MIPLINPAEPDPDIRIGFAQTLSLTRLILVDQKENQTKPANFEEVHLENEEDVSSYQRWRSRWSRS
jgi:hypothetical protein